MRAKFSDLWATKASLHRTACACLVQVRIERGKGSERSVEPLTCPHRFVLDLLPILWCAKNAHASREWCW